MTDLVPQKHGGAIWQGAPANPVPGPGRPRDEIRAKLRGIANGKGIDFLSDLLDGKLTVQLIGKCAACGETGTPDPLWLKGLMEQIGASVDQRLKANEQALKYGVGVQTQTLTPEQVEADAEAITRAFIAIAVERWGRTLAEAQAAAQEMAQAARGDH